MFDKDRYYTNQYKDVITQREFSAYEARSLIAPRLYLGNWVIPPKNHGVHK